MRKAVIGFLLATQVFIPSFSYALEPNDAYFFDEWYLNQIDAQSAWDVSTGSESIIVAVLDAGVDVDHEDLQANMWVNTGEIASNGIDDDGNGFIDDVNGWDFIDDDASVTPDITIGANPEAAEHGSLVAGLVGAVGNNGVGVAGVNWNIKIMPVRMLDRVGSGTSGDAIRSIEYAVENGARVINLSFSGTTPDPELRQTVRWAHENGVVIVSALGNDNLNVNDSPVYPACYDSETEDWVIGVVASDALDQKASYSNYGSQCADITAPGSEIFGVSYYDPENGFAEKYMNGWSGTSMAAPLVSGSIALLLSKYPSATPDEIKTILQLSVDPMQNTGDVQGQLGAGRLNIGNAFALADQFFGLEIDVSISGSASSIGIEVIRSSSFSSVYDISGDDRRAFMNEAAYFTYFDSFSAVETVNDSDLSSYQLTGVILPKPGVVLVKIQSAPTVYLIDENSTDQYRPILRAIGSESVAEAMYGAHWADYVIDIEPTFFGKFAMGNPVTSAYSIDTSIMKTRQQLAALSQSYAK
ncbi:MAG: S8 family peptidase [Patescibacteria group bacterium]|jgi:subtilisin family serine protease